MCAKSNKFTDKKCVCVHAVVCSCTGERELERGREAGREREREGVSRGCARHTQTDMGVREMLLIQTKEILEDFPKSVISELNWEGPPEIDHLKERSGPGSWRLERPS